MPPRTVLVVARPAWGRRYVVEVTRGPGRTQEIEPVVAQWRGRLSGKRAVVRLLWDWLRPQVTVPFVPTIGPVHPDELGSGGFSDVISVAGTDRFLGYDKDRRWFDAKAESVLVDDIVHFQHETWLPVLSRHGAGSATVYVYGVSPEDHQGARQLASTLRSTHGATTASVVWFIGREDPSQDPCERLVVVAVRTR